MKRLRNIIFYTALGIVFVGGFVVRLYKINSPVADWHSWRQADTASVSYIYSKDGFNLLYPRYFDISFVQTGFFNPNGWRFVEFPLFNVAHVVLFKTIGHLTFDAWGRMVSVISSSVTTVALFFVGRRLIGRWGGLTSAFFYAFLPYNIFFTRVILPEPMGVAFVVLGLWAGIEYFYKPSTLKLFTSALFFALALLMKPFMGFYALPLVYLAVKKYGVTGLFTKKSLLLALDFALIPFFLWRAWVNSSNRIIGIPFFSWAFNGDGIRFRPSFWNWIFAERLGKLILGMWGLGPFCIGVLQSTSKYKVIALSLFGMFLYVSIIATANVRHDYYQTLTVPAIVLTLAAGVDWLWNHSSFNKFATRALLFFCVGMALLTGWYQMRDDYQVNHPEIIVAGEAVQRLTNSNARVIAPYNGDTAFLYQTKRFGWPVVDRSIEEMTEMGADYYVSVNYDADTNNFMKKFKTIEKTSQYIILDLHSKL